MSCIVPTTRLQMAVVEKAVSIEDVIRALQELPDTILRPYAQSFVTEG